MAPPPVHAQMPPGQRRLLKWPMYFAVMWMLAPLMLILIAPFSLQIKNEPLVYSYILLNALAFCIGYRVCGLKSLEIVSEQRHVKRVRTVIHRGFWLALIILPFAIFFYTGKSIFDIASILDQREVYEDLADVFQEESSTRKLVSLIRGFAAPFTIAVIPLTTFYWSSLSRKTRWFAFGTAMTYVLLSAFRGTDKEMGDLIILGFSGFAARAAFLKARGKVTSKRDVAKTALIASAAIAVFVSLFVFRKSERLGGFVSFCLFGDAACFESGGTGGIGDIVNFGLAMFSSYLVQGYYGLSLALPLDFEWTFGVGHSTPLQTIFGLFVDTKAIYEHGLMAQLRTVGWDDRFVWSSIFPVLASDVGFLGVPLLFLAIGSLYGRSWRIAVLQGHPAALMLFSLLTILVLYIPANNQLAQSFDLYFAAIFWLTTFVMRKFQYVSR